MNNHAWLPNLPTVGSTDKGSANGATRARHASDVAFPTISPPGYWHLFHVGFWLVMLAWASLVFMKTRWRIDSIYLSAPLLSLGMTCLLLAAVRIWQRSTVRLGPGSAFLLRYLLLWGLLTVLRDFTHLNVNLIRDTFGIRYFAWTWFVPIVVVFAMDPRFLREVLRSMLQQARLGLIVLVVAPLPPLSLFTTFDLTWGASALTLFWGQLTRWGRRIAIAGALVTLFFAILQSERHAIIGHGFLLLGAAYILFMQRHRFAGRRRLGVIALFLSLAGIVYYAAYTDNLWFLADSTNERVASFKEELFVNTRVSHTGVSLYEDFLNDLSMVDLLFGRGAVGVYRSAESGGALRPIIECGYCQVVLKGGLLMLVPMMLLALSALWLGLFASRNWVVKAFALIIAGWLVEMVPFGVPAAFPRYILFWIAIGVCLNRSLRYMSDAEIGNWLLEKGKGVDTIGDRCLQRTGLNGLADSSTVPTAHRPGDMRS